MSWIEQVRFGEGLVPVIAQDAATGEVLMLAWADAEALRLTAETRQAHYWSRSRARLWRKGESSGNTQEVVEVRLDCDLDAVLYRVQSAGAACHTGERSCFHRLAEDGLPAAGDARPLLARLDEVIAARQEVLPEGSYTTYLFREGVDKILKKVGEEATETVIAAKNAGNEALRAESADLLFHLLVLWRARGLALEEIWDELEQRFGLAPRAGSAEPAPRRSADGT